MGPHVLEAEYESAKRVMDSIRRIVQDLRMSSRNAERLTGLSSAQLFVLQQLRSGGKLSMNEIAQLTFTHQSTVSEVVGRLLAAKMLTRKVSGKDARRLEISITAKGLSELKRAPRTTQEDLVAGLRAMPESRRGELANLMEELLGKAGLSKREEAPLFFEKNGGGGKPQKNRRRLG